MCIMMRAISLLTVALVIFCKADDANDNSHSHHEIHMPVLPIIKVPNLPDLPFDLVEKLVKSSGEKVQSLLKYVPELDHLKVKNKLPLEDFIKEVNGMEHKLKNVKVNSLSTLHEFLNDIYEFIHKIKTNAEKFIEELPLKIRNVFRNVMLEFTTIEKAIRGIANLANIQIGVRVSDTKPDTDPEFHFGFGL